jgi:hypothetical protein
MQILQEALFCNLENDRELPCACEGCQNKIFRKDGKGAGAHIAVTNTDKKIIGTAVVPLCNGCHNKRGGLIGLKKGTRGIMDVNCAIDGRSKKDVDDLVDSSHEFWKRYVNRYGCLLS